MPAPGQSWLASRHIHPACCATILNGWQRLEEAKASADRAVEIWRRTTARSGRSGPLCWTGMPSIRW